MNANTRIKRIQAALKQMQVQAPVYTVCFSDGSRRDVSFMEAIGLCFDETVTDAFAKNNETGTSLLRAIINAGNDFDGLKELEELEE